MNRMALAAFLAAGTASAQIPGFTSTPINVPAQVSQAVLDPSGNVWVADPTRLVLGKLELPSNTYKTFPIPADEHARISYIAAAPDGSIWYADTKNPIIGRLSPDGSITRFTVPHIPNHIAASPDNGVFYDYLAAPQFGTVGYLSAGPGLRSIQLAVPDGSVPENLTVGPDGVLCFTDLKANHRIVRLGLSGGLESYPDTTANPSDSSSWNPQVTSGPDGNIWFTHATTIGRLRLSDGVVTHFPIPYANAGASGITAGADGNIWFADSDAGANVVSQLVVASATDDGHATINKSSQIGTPEGILNVTSPQLQSTVIARAPELATSCPNLAFVITQNETATSGSNLAFATAPAAGNDCADLQITAESLGLFDPKHLVLTFGIRNDGPNAATQLTMVLSKIQGLTSMSISSLAGWTCNPENGTLLTCTRDSDMAPGDSDTAYVLIQMTSGSTLPPESELEIRVRAATADPYPSNNFLNARYFPPTGRFTIVLREPGNSTMQVVGGRD